MTEIDVPRAPDHTIEVTSETIKSAARRDSSHCMIADSIRLHIPEAQYVSVDIQTIRYSDPAKGLRYTWLTPRVCQEAIVKWDSGQEPEGFSFRLRYGQVTQSGAGGSRKHGLKGKKVSREERAKAEGLKTAKLVKHHISAGTVPEIVGGKTPPVVKGGNRREFGIRALTP